MTIVAEKYNYVIGTDTTHETVFTPSAMSATESWSNLGISNPSSWHQASHRLGDAAYDQFRATVCD